MTSPIYAIKQYEKIVTDVFDILCKDWDPYDIYSMENERNAKLEYEQYLSDVLNVLLSDKNQKEVEKAFKQIVADMYGGGDKDNLDDIVPFPEATAKLLQLRTDLKKYFQLAQIEYSHYSYDDIQQIKKVELELEKDLEYADR